MTFRWLLTGAVWWTILVSGASAGQYVLVADQPNTVPVAVRVENGEPACNVEITVQGQPPFDREVRAPHYEARVVITPQETGQVNVSWRGKPRRVNEAVFNACPTLGQTQFTVVSSFAQNRANWEVLFASFGPQKAECVRSAFRVEGVYPDAYDLNDRQVTREDWKIHRALTQCDALLAQKKAWGDQNPRGYACTLAGGLKTQCEGYYTASVNGKVQPVDDETAVQLQLNGVPLGTAVRETAGSKTARARRVQAEQARIEADAAAKIKAEEEALAQKIRQSQEARQAAIKAKKDQEAADLAEKLAVLARVEQEEKARRSWVRKQLDNFRENSGIETTPRPKPVQKPEEKPAAKGHGDKKDAKPDAGHH